MDFKVINQQFDLIIIGAGASGLTAGINAYKSGIRNIAIISKVLPINSHTASAKGGINASLGNVVEDDWKWHAFDTLKGGDYLADSDAVEILCKNAKEAIVELEHLGVVFSRNEDGYIAQRAYGGQSTNYGNGGVAYRACYSKDKTGHTMLSALYNQALKLNIKFFSEFFVSDLLLAKQDDANTEKQCYGCIAIDLNNGEINIFKAFATIIATGGYSQIYKNSTSSLICSGDGAGLLLKLGYFMQDMEFVQFHPTGIAGFGFLITEAVRSEGAYLLNGEGERFMKNYAPKMLELASRDVVSQAMATEIHQGRGCGNKKDYIYLDMRHFSQETFVNKLPGVVELVKKFLNLDVSKDLIPVAPSAHYNMGGIPTDNNAVVLDFKIIDNQLSENKINGLFAIGESACFSVHGANRLGCNSLLDLLVFGKIAGNYCVKIINQLQSEKTKNLDYINNLISSKIDSLKAVLCKSLSNNDKKHFTLSSLKIDLQKNNEKNLSVFRNQSILIEGLEANFSFYKKLKTYIFSNKNLLWNQELIDYLELENLLLNAIITNIGALHRLESRGAHYRSDFNFRDDNKFLAHSLVRLKSFENLILEDLKNDLLVDLTETANIINRSNYQFLLRKVRNYSEIEELRLIPSPRNY